VAQAAKLQLRLEALQRDLEAQQGRANVQLALAPQQGARDSELEAAVRRVSELERDNARLKQVAAKREAVLAQSRAFMEQLMVAKEGAK
jgi:hypothetical protein